MQSKAFRWCSFCLISSSLTLLLTEWLRFDLILSGAAGWSSTGSHGSSVMTTELSILRFKNFSLRRLYNLTMELQRYLQSTSKKCKQECITEKQTITGRDTKRKFFSWMDTTEVTGSKFFFSAWFPFLWHFAEFFPNISTGRNKEWCLKTPN